MSAQPQETGTFTSAREFFDAAREAKPDQKRAEELLEQIESEQPHGSGLGAHVRSSPRADAMAAIVARRMDRAERLRLRIEVDHEHSAFPRRERRREIDDRRRLADASLLVRDCNYLRSSFHVPLLLFSSL